MRLKSTNLYKKKSRVENETVNVNEANNISKLKKVEISKRYASMSVTASRSWAHTQHSRSYIL